MWSADSCGLGPLPRDGTTQVTRFMWKMLSPSEPFHGLCTLFEIEKVVRISTFNNSYYIIPFFITVTKDYRQVTFEKKGIGSKFWRYRV